MNSIYKYAFVVPAIFALVLISFSSQAQAGDVKIIIGGHGFDRHHYKHNIGFKRYYNKSRHNYRHNLGYKDHYYPKRYYKKKYYGNYYKPKRYYGYSNGYRYNNRNYYRGNRNYCPY